MKVSVIVLHNVNLTGMLLGYNARTAQLHLADKFDVHADSLQHAADVAWVICNVDSPNDLPTYLREHVETVKKYRERRNRSLSVGDVLILEGQGERIGLAVEIAGHKKVDVDDAWITVGTVNGASAAANASRALAEDVRAHGHIELGILVENVYEDGEKVDFRVDLMIPGPPPGDRDDWAYQWIFSATGTNRSGDAGYFVTVERSSRPDVIPVGDTYEWGI